MKRSLFILLFLPLMASAARPCAEMLKGSALSKKVDALAREFVLIQKSSSASEIQSRQQNFSRELNSFFVLHPAARESFKAKVGELMSKPGLVKTNSEIELEKQKKIPALPVRIDQALHDWSIQPGNSATNWNIHSGNSKIISSEGQRIFVRDLKTKHAQIQIDTQSLAPYEKILDVQLNSDETKIYFATDRYIAVLDAQTGAQVDAIAFNTRAVGVEINGATDRAALSLVYNEKENFTDVLDLTKKRSVLGQKIRGYEIFHSNANLLGDFVTVRSSEKKVVVVQHRNTGAWTQRLFGLVNSTTAYTDEFSTSYSPTQDKNLLLILNPAQKMTLVNLTTGKKIFSVKSQVQDLEFVHITGDTSWFYARSYNGRLFKVDSSTGEAQLISARSDFCQYLFSPKGAVYLVYTKETVSLMDAETHNVITTVPAKFTDIESVEFVENETAVLISTQRGELHKWSLYKFEKVK